MDKEEKTENKGGRPPLFKSVDDLQSKIDVYFKECEDLEEIPTIAGLAYALETDRQTIYKYEKKDMFSDTIKKARNFIISRIERNLVNSKGNVTGGIFLAKNYGYKDKQEIESTITKKDAPLDVCKLTPDDLVQLSNMMKKVMQPVNEGELVPKNE
jgi:hypothetical protein